MSITIRPAQLSDLPRIVAIYNQAISKKGMTADLKLQNVADKQDWFDQHKPEQYPIFVAIKNDELVGWGSLSAYREGRDALKYVTEVSLYFDENHTGRGLGTALMQQLLAEAKELGYTNMIAIIISSNEKSIGLFTKFSFNLWGLLPNVVTIDQQHFNHCIYGRSL
ncbi:MAG: N-acetyltransferase [Chitinophagaceae bacterium]|nr:N-acetyltransferase [Chitinophagaceae bacterium]